MSCKPPTGKQKRYASSLVGRLLNDNHWKANRYDEQVTACTCIAEMSSLIDKMKGEVADEPHERRW
jgi:hypothetical protein